MGYIYARLIHKQVYGGIDTGYNSITDVPSRDRAATRIAWNTIYGTSIPE